jgi:hypothetical protein
MVEEPGTLTETWSKDAVAPEGRPLALKLTDPVKPADGATATV